MNKKAVYLVVIAVVAMIVLSFSLVMIVGPKVNADDGEWRVGVLDKTEYFRIYQDEFDDELGYAPVVLRGLSDLGDKYSNQYDELRVVVPEGVTDVCGFTAFPYNYYTIFGAFSYFKAEYYSNHATSKVTSIILPNTLKVLGEAAFKNAQIESIVIPANVTKFYYVGFYGTPCYAFDGCNYLTEIIVENEDLLNNEYLSTNFADIMRYQEPSVVEPETPVDNTPVVKNQNNTAIIAGVAATSTGGILVCGIVIGVVIARRRRK